MILNNDWSIFLQEELNEEYFIKLQEHIILEYNTKIIFPKYDNIFKAFNLTSVSGLRVVIVGQDPYHGFHQANGLAFSVCDKCKIPPSLKNIFKELQDDTGCDLPTNGNLTKWAKSGILLINSVLTVVESKANSHKGIGWEVFTDAVIKKLSDEFTNIVFILWGNPSRKKEVLIDNSKHLVIKAPHPSPLSSYRGFFGSKPFSKTNKYLLSHNKKEIDWCLN